jgi:hypothetical protein
MASCRRYFARRGFAMLDFVFAVGQLLCILGLLYGLFLVLAHSDCVDAMRQHYDPITGHDWLAIRIASDKSVAVASTPAERQTRVHIPAESAQVS